MHKYQLETPKHLIHANGTGDTSLEGEFYCENYKEQIKSLSKDEDTFYASPEEAITRMSSNHPKRMINPDITLNLLCESEEKIEHAYSINTYHPEMENQILIAGDSHAEFYSRIPWRSKSEWSHACLGQEQQLHRLCNRFIQHRNDTSYWNPLAHRETKTQTNTFIWRNRCTPPYVWHDNSQ